MAACEPAVTVPVTVEFEDVDSYRIAHHTELVTYLERARLRLLVSLGAKLDVVAPVVYKLELRFRRPARMMDQLEVTAWVREFDEHWLALGYRIRRGREVLVTARSVIAFADLQSGELTTIPAEVMGALRESRRRE